MNMENQQLKLQLQSFGFGEKETTVYVALLELGKGTVSQISRKAGINRTTGYDILASLSNKGLVTISGKEPKSEYAVEPPESIVRFLKQKFYEGNEGLKHVYEDTLTSREPIRAYATVDDMHKALPNYFPEYYNRRTQK